MTKLLSAQDYTLIPWKNARMENRADPTFSSGDKGLFYIDAAGNVRINDGTNLATLRSTAVALVNGDIAANAAIALSKLAVDPLARANHTGTQLAATISDFNAAIAASAALANASTQDRARANHTGTQLSSTISDFATAAQGAITEAIVRARLAAATAAIGVNAQRITSVADPMADTDATNKRYVDNLVQGLDAKQSVRARYTDRGEFWDPSGNTLTRSVTGQTPATSFDGVLLAAGDRILMIDPLVNAGGSTYPTNNAYNGIYTVTTLGASGVKMVLTRASDMDTWAEVPSAFTFIEEGTDYAETGWIAQADRGNTLNSTPIPFVQFSSAGIILAGTGLVKVGNTLSLAGRGVDSGILALGAVRASNVSVDVFGGSGSILRGLRFDASYGNVIVDADEATLTVPYVANGPTATHPSTGASYNRNPIKVKDGGIGATQLADGAILLDGPKIGANVLPIEKGGTASANVETARRNLNAIGQYSTATHDAGSQIFIPYSTHNLGSGNGFKMVKLYIDATGEEVVADVKVENPFGDVRITFAQAQAANTIRVVIFG